MYNPNLKTRNVTKQNKKKYIFLLLEIRTKIENNGGAEGTFGGQARGEDN